MQSPVRLLPLGDAAWTLEFGNTIDAAVHARVLGFVESLARARQVEPWAAVIVDVVPSFRSVTVHFDPSQAEATALGSQLMGLTQLNGQSTLQGRHWCLPVCFDAEYSPDLDRVCEQAQLSANQVIDAILSVSLRVYMIGFQPGFPYMGELPEALKVPRLGSPRQKVPAQSVAIALQMCAVYPWDSPGGWNLVGRTPVVLFDPLQWGQPAMLAAGDKVSWRHIDQRQYLSLMADLRHGLPRDTFCQGAAA